MAKQTFTANQVLTAAQMNSLQANDYNWTVDTKTDSYVLVAGDAGKRIVMNAATAKTITVNTSIFTAGDTVWIHNINTGTCTVTAGTATVNTAGSLALAQWEGGALYFTSASTAIFFRGGGANYGVATGGTSASRTIGGVNYTVLTFASDDNLVVSKAGLFDVLLVGGGGGGAGSVSSGSAAGGGGGAGALVGYATTTTIYLAAGTYAVDVGAGGAGSTSNPICGAASYIGSIISACGGGSAGCGDSVFVRDRASGGGSGGGSAGDQIQAGESVDETFGNDGGKNGVSTAATAGGGGGYASAGGNGDGTAGGSGGNGQDVSSWGTSASTDNVAAGGGGGGGTTGGAAGTGGVAGKTSGTGNAATTAGSGGGGTYGNSAGGAGAAGKVWVRFKV